MRDWWEAGCPRALSIQTWALAMPAVVAFALVVTSSRSNTLPATAVLSVLAGYLMAGIVASCVRHLIVRQSASRQARWSLLVLVVAGPITVFGARAMVSLAGFPAQGAPPAVAVVAACVGAVWLTAAAQVVYWSDQLSDARGVLMRELGRQQLLVQSARDQRDQDRQRILTDIETTLEAGLEPASDGEAAIVRVLDGVVADVIRPVSHGLHHRRVSEEELFHRPFDLSGPGQVHWGAFRALRSRPARGDVFLVGGMFASAVLALASTIRLEQMSVLIAVSVGLLVSWAAGLGWLVLTSHAAAVGERAEAQAALAAADWASARLQQALWVSRRQLANSLHGPVQARVISAALQLRQSDVDDWAHVVARLRRDLNSLLRAEDEDGDWRLGWARLLQTWSLSIHIDARFDDRVAEALDRDQVAGQALVAVVGEAVTNAVRHGGARTVTITIDRVPGDQLTVIVDDDGQMDETGSDPGLGTLVFEAACLDWSLVNQPAGHRLIARVPVVNAVEKTEATMGVL